jgi:hypothetical protein
MLGPMLTKIAHVESSALSFAEGAEPYHPLDLSEPSIGQAKIER